MEPKISGCLSGCFQHHLFSSSCFTRMCSRCLWDADTDNYAEDVFMNVGAFVLITLVIGGGGLTSQRQFRFNSLCFNKTYSPCFHFIGQLVLCGGSFWELLLLRMTRWMTEIFQMEGCELYSAHHHHFGSIVHLE